VESQELSLRENELLNEDDNNPYSRAKKEKVNDSELSIFSKDFNPGLKHGALQPLNHKVTMSHAKSKIGDRTLSMLGNDFAKHALVAVETDTDA